MAALREAVAGAKGDDPLAPVTIVVPTDRIGVAARRGLARAGVGTGTGVAGITVLTLRRLAESIATAALTADGRRPITQTVLVSALDRLLSQQPGLFADVADHPETARSLARSHNDLRLLPASTVARVATATPVTADVVRVHHATSDLLTPTHYDEVDLLRAAALSVHGEAALPPVVLYLPGEPDPPQRELVESLVQATSVTAIVGLSGATADHRVQTAWAQLLGAPERAVAVAPATGDAVIAATDADDEVRAVVREVVSRLASGTPGHRIAVLYGAREPYARLLAEHLQASGVTFNGRGVRPAGERILGRALRRLLGLPMHEFRRDEVMGLVTDAPVQWRGRRAPATRWEKISRKAGVVRGDDWQTRLADYAAREREKAEKMRLQPEAAADAGGWRDRDADAADALAAFVATARDRLAEADATTSWAALATTIETLWHDLVPTGDATWLPEEERQVADTIAGVLRSLPALDDISAPVSLTALRELVDLEMHSELDRVGRAGIGVHVGPVRDGVGHELDAVYVVGMAEGLFPPRPTEDPLIPDVARELTGGVLPTLTSRVDDQHRQLLAALASTPPGSPSAPRRVLTFPRGDLRRSGTRLPSRWLVPTLAALGGAPGLVATEWETVVGRPGLDVIPSYTAAVTSSPRPGSDQEWRQRAHAAGAVLSLEPVVARGREMRAARRSSVLTRFEGLVGPHPLVGLPADAVLSPTSLEAWFSCPHRYLVQHVLGVREVDDPEEVISISAMDKGDVMHRVLDRFVGEAVQAGKVPGPGQPWSANDERRLVHIVDEELAREQREGSVGLTAMWQTASRAMREDLRRFVDEDSSRRAATTLSPVASELTFGRHDRPSAPPVHVLLGDGRTLLIRGSIDRVDSGPDGLAVIDYKTGAAKRYGDLSAENPTDHGRYLQLGLYAAAARQMLGRPDVDVEVAYWFITRKAKFERVGYRVSADTTAATQAVLRAAVDGISAGLFPPRPNEHSGGYGCAACDPDGLGDRTSVARFEQLLALPEMADYAGVVVGSAGLVGATEGEPA
jgi:hypothetical protein